MNLLTLDNLTQKNSTYLTEDEVKTIEKAYIYAKNAHKDQFRQSGAPYIQHPLTVACILAELHQDVSTICGGLLHDTIEDTSISKEDIEKEFGKDIRRLVEGVTKLGKLQFESKEEEQAENFRKMFLAMAQDLRVVIIKLADRLHNMRTISYLKEHKQNRIAQETRDIFSPLAHRLGMWSLKWELEDISFRILQPKEFKKIRDHVDARREERETYVNSMTRKVQTLLKQSHIKGDVNGRPKHFHSIYKKLQKQNINYEDLYDTLGIRIKVESIKDCYEILGILHSTFKPISGRIKDYIAVPKSNLYQSLHTTVIGPEGKPVEIQIRTHQMHEIAEYGIAAHWQYKEKKKQPDGDFSWLRQIIEVQKETTEPHEFMKELKLDLFIDEVFVFTPAGDIQVLPKGATPIDFAYRIHTDVGNTCTGAKINTKIASLNSELKNGDQVSIFTSRNSTPKVDWLNFVKTSQAKNRIRSWHRKQKKSLLLEDGKKTLEKVLLMSGLLPKECLNQENLELFKEKLHITDYNNLYLKIGQGEITAKEIVTIYNRSQKDNSVDPIYLTQSKRKPSTNTSQISVLGEKNVETRLSKCCKPIPGDSIIGFVTRGTGISIHRQSCTHALNFSKTCPDRLINVTWESPNTKTAYSTQLLIEGLIRNGLIQDIMKIINELNINLISVKTSTRKKEGTQIISIIIDIHSTKQLETLRQKIMQLADILVVKRQKDT